MTRATLRGYHHEKVKIMPIPDGKVVDQICKVGQARSKTKSAKSAHRLLPNVAPQLDRQPKAEK